MLNVSILLLLVQLANDVAIQPGPGQAQSLNGLRICQWNVQHLTDNKLEEIRAMLRQPSNDQDRLDIRILSDTFCSHKVPDSFYGIYGLQFHRKERQAVDKSIKERVLKHNMVRLFLPYKTRSFFEGQEDTVDFVFRIFSGSGARFFKRSCRRTKIPWGRRRGNI